MSKVLLVEDNTSTVKKIVCYIDNISADLEVHSVSEAGEALQMQKRTMFPFLSLIFS